VRQRWAAVQSGGEFERVGENLPPTDQGRGGGESEKIVLQKCHPVFPTKLKPRRFPFSITGNPPRPPAGNSDTRRSARKYTRSARVVASPNRRLRWRGGI